MNGFKDVECSLLYNHLEPLPSSSRLCLHLLEGSCRPHLSKLDSLCSLRNFIEHLAGMNTFVSKPNKSNAC